MKNRIKTILLMTLLLSIMLSSGCGSKVEETQVPEEPKYADQDFVLAMSDGLQARWDLNIKYEKNGSYNNVNLNSKEYQNIILNLIDKELEHIQNYTEEKFEDKKLQENAIKYINLLEAHKEVCSYIPVDYVKYETDYDPIYDERSKIIEHMVEEYGMTVDEKHQQELDSFVAKSQMVLSEEKQKESIQKMLDAAQFQKVENDQYGNMNMYHAVIENTTDIDFNSIQVSINLLDAEGVILETTYDQISAFTKGSKAQFEILTDKEFTSTKVVANYWD